MTARKRILQLGLGVAAAALLAAVPPCSASAQDVLFPETIQVQKYTGTFQKEFHIDIDSDGEKEAIGYYYVGSKRDGYSISDVYSVFDTNSESYILYRRISNEHMNYKFHIIQDNNTNETFLGYVYTILGNEMLYRLYSDNQSELIINYDVNTDGLDKLQAYKTYMNNVHFLDEAAYGHGDVDGDADVTVSDAVSILSYYAATAAGQSPSFTELQKQAADFNQDGMISVEDAVKTLSLYAEHAAGMVDTVLLPTTIRKDSSPFSLYGGTLESTFYLDIDDDGKKETIGRYDHIEGRYELCSDCIFQVYDDGTFQGSFGGNTDSQIFSHTMLVYDHNIDEIYLANCGGHLTLGCGSPGLRNLYPNYGKYIIYIETTGMKPDIKINGKDATKQEIYDYLDQIEIISSDSNDEQLLEQFKKLIIDRYL
ncbi:MAG: dockerin type I domain-containing protein [Ruminococcus sp.]|nr:dockerin type I domain-containing protein [Ruminococcus sp.]